VFYLRENSISSVDLSAIHLSNCNAVVFDSNAVRRIRGLREVQLNGIKNLTLEESGLAWEGYVSSIDINTPTLQISIRDSYIHQISSYTFSGRISRITFENVVIAQILPFAFSSLVQSQRIAFSNMTAEHVQAQAFKKFTTGQLTISNSNMTYLPSRSFSEVTVTENLLISNSSFGTIKSGAFLIYNPNRFEVTDSKFDVLEGEAFRVTTRGDALFRNVHFNTSYPSAFVGISVNLAETSTRKTITFSSPIFETFEVDALRINRTSFDLKLVNVCVKWSCDCDTMSSAFENIDQIEELNCVLDDSYTNYQEFRNTSCILFASNATVIIAICVTLILLLILGIALWCFFKKAYRCDKYGGEKDKKKKLSMIVPDGRTYRETELHV
ncbi:hypothetical protein Trydic_g11992, partial [Trypoxylus dichotomus]